MWGAIIGGALKVGSSIFGGAKASQAMKQRKAYIEGLQRENQDWYDRRYNEDMTQRADAQALLSQTMDTIRNRNRAAAGRQAVMGGTDESVTAEKQANNQLLGDTVSRINAAGEARKQGIEDSYRRTKQGLTGQLADLEAQRAQNITDAVKGVADAGAGIATAIGGNDLGSLLKKKQDKN